MNFNRRRLFRCAQAAVALLGATMAAKAGDAPVIADTYVSSLTTPNDLTHDNYGTAVNLNVGSGGQALIEFDLSQFSFPVSKAVMVVFANKVSTSGSMDVWSLAGPWTETGVSLNGGTSPTTTTPLPPTKNFLGTVALTAGGTYRTLDITAQVNRWLAGSDPNDGILLVPSPGSNLSATFDAKENFSTSHAAYIDLLQAGPGGNTGQIQINSNGAFAGISLPASGLLKGASGPSFAQAVSGTDYAPATTGANGQALTANGSGGFGLPLTLATVAVTGNYNDLIGRPSGSAHGLLTSTFLLCAGPCTINETSNWKWTAPVALSITGCTIDAMTYPTGSAVTVDVLKNGGATIFASAVPALAGGAASFNTQTGMSAAAALNPGDYLIAKVTGAGSIVAGQFVNLVCIASY